MAGQGTCYTFHITVTVVKAPPYRRGPTRATTAFDGRVTLEIDISRRGRRRLGPSVLDGVSPDPHTCLTADRRHGSHGTNGSLGHSTVGSLSPHVFIIWIPTELTPWNRAAGRVPTMQRGTPHPAPSVIIPLRVGAGGVKHNFSITISTVVTHTTTSSGGMEVLPPLTVIEAPVIGGVVGGMHAPSLRPP